ncbi:MAG TPA: choice-of-anchor Q domain-containing protein, partial [Aquihabitans sp.]|nr:choice-of-anchor Q domain-containing protein [Aquihabitans sp.]
MGTARKVRSAVAIALVSTVVVLVAQAPPASAASITVNTALDIAPNAQGQFPTDGKCSLRAAIQSAQNNSNAHDVDCSTGAPVANVLDTVQIDPSLAGQTMTLTYSIAGAVQPFPTISGPTNPMKIIGPNTNAAAFKISGGGAVRPFIVGFLTAEAGNLTLANLTVQGGNGANGAAGAFAVNGQGGALYASDNSKLTFDNAVFTGNSAVKGGAIYAEWPTITNNGGAYTSNSASDEGGAIFLNQGPSTLNGYAMLLASNTAGDKGGAIAVNPGSSNPFIHLERSLIRNNSTSIAGNGGVVYIQPSGAPTGTTFELTDSTVFANSSVFLSTATTQKYNFERSTFKDTGNLINGTGGGTVWNSIITGTSCQTQVAIGNFVGAGNLISPGSCDLMGMGSMGSVTGMSATLAQNGGPEVQQTFALSAGSNAIDNGGNAHCGTVDARSVTRGLDGNGILNNPQVGDCDIGAYEYAKYVVNFVTGTSTAKEDAGTKNVQVKLRILDPGISSTPSAVFVPITNQATSTATISNDFTLGGGGVTFPAGSVDGAVANLQVNLIQDDVAELFGEEAHLDLATNVVGVAIAEPNSHTLSIQDDDQAGVIVDDGGNGTNVAEATPLVGEDITVRLQSQPDRQLLDPTKPGLPASYGPPANVTMSVNVDRDCIVLWNGEVASIGDPFQITIPNADWKTGRTMTVRSKDDLYDEDLRVETVKHTCEIRFTFESLDPIYDATQDAYEANIADNDVAGVNLDRKSGPAVLRENTVDAATYELMLDTPPDPGKPLPPSPRPPTVITLSVGTGCDIGAGDGKPMTYAFTEANWSTARTVSVTSTNNLVVELLHPCTITSSVSGGDPIYNDLSQPPTFSGTPPTATEQVQDYDPPGVTDDPPFAVVTTNGADGAD